MIILINIIVLFLFGTLMVDKEGRSGRDIERHACGSCGACVAVCDHDAIILFEDAIVISRNSCGNCGNCIRICPSGDMKSIYKKIKRELSF